MTDSAILYQESFFAALRAAGLPEAYATEETARRMALLSSRLGEFGKRFNLTAITEPTEVLLKHVIDSLMAAPLIVFLAVNWGIVPEIRTAFLSIPRMPEMRGSEVSFANLYENAYRMVKTFLFQRDGMIWNARTPTACIIIFRCRLCCWAARSASCAR